jgi:phosphoenolpyruvate carboxylase
MRVFIARSDPAMNAGIIPTMLGVKSALSAFHAFGEKHGIKMYPWIGGGSLPFRGAINPDNVSNILDEYRGAYSLTIQSAFRSDYPLDKVKKAIKTFNKELPKNLKNYIKVSDAELEKVLKFNKEAERIFKKTIEPLAPLINEIADQMPSNRERAQHTGLFKYSRGVGSVDLPRAIKFTGALYSIGLPPEYIATGRVIALAKKKRMLPLIEKLYVNMKSDLRHAGKYLNKENLDLYAKEFPILKQVKKDIQEIEKHLNIKLGPTMSRHFLHRNSSSSVYYLRRDGEDYKEELKKMAEFRRSLG